MEDQPAASASNQRCVRKLQPQIRPFLKWAGGKRQIIAELLKHVPDQFQTYFEPFLGGGAMLFALQPSKAVINDINPEIVNCYLCVCHKPDQLVSQLRTFHNDEHMFYAIRQIDRDPASYAQLTPVESAARIIYLNKTCYNGLYRVNKHGQFNVPFGHYANPAIVDEAAIFAAGQYLNDADMTFLCGDFAQAMSTAQQGDFAYLDPPYAPVSKTASFTSYAKEKFGTEQQYQLRSLVDRLHQHRVQFLLSNHPSDFINQLYAGYQTTRIDAKRAINSRGDKRGTIQELLVWNYPITE